jgi:hypothetical protein
VEIDGKQILWMLQNKQTIPNDTSEAHENAQGTDSFLSVLLRFGSFGCLTRLLLTKLSVSFLTFRASRGITLGIVCLFSIKVFVCHQFPLQQLHNKIVWKETGTHVR